MRQRPDRQPIELEAVAVDLGEKLKILTLILEEIRELLRQLLPDEGERQDTLFPAERE